MNLTIWQFAQALWEQNIYFWMFGAVCLGIGLTDTIDWLLMMHRHKRVYKIPKILEGEEYTKLVN
jgi:hypothetical protein